MKTVDMVGKVCQVVWNDLIVQMYVESYQSEIELNITRYRGVLIDGSKFNLVLDSYKSVMVLGTRKQYPEFTI